MNRIGVFVDAGYFWVQVAQVVHGSKQARDSVAIDYAILREKLLAEVAAQFAGGELLRVYWYDGPGTFSHKAHSHVAIDDLDDFKLRLGTRNTYGDQKAVDGLIIADLVSLAQSRAILSAIVVSGDADLTPGVIAAQGLGMRVHMLSLGPANATSPFLRAEVDRKQHWDDSVVHAFATARTPSFSEHEPPDAEAHAALLADVPLAEIAAAAFAQIPADEIATLSPHGALPRPLDALLLRTGKIRLGRPLDEAEKRALREEMKQVLNAARADSVSTETAMDDDGPGVGA